MTNKIKQHAPAVALTGQHITAPINPHGHCFGLIPAGGDWLDDLIDWPRRQFKRAEDAQRVAASWNLLAYIPLVDLLAPDPKPQHPDETAIDNFAVGMKAAMAVGRAEGKAGWQDSEECTEVHLQSLLRAAISKGNPVHVGNYAMMLHNRGERTAHPSAAKLQAALMDCHSKAAIKAVAPAGFADAVRCLSSAFNALEACADSDLNHFENEEEEAECAPAQFAARKIAQALELLYVPAPALKECTAIQMIDEEIDRTPLTQGDHVLPE